MVEKFLIDSNSFMTPYRQYYAFDLVPTFWKELSKRTDSGNLILLDMVKAEIEKGKDKSYHRPYGNFGFWKEAYGEVRHTLPDG